MKLPPGDLDIAHAKLIVPESDGTIQPVAEGGELPFTIAGDRMLCCGKLIAGGPSRVDIFDARGQAKSAALPLPDVAAVDEVESPAGSNSVHVSRSRPICARLISPATTGKTRKVTETKLVEEPARSKFDDAEVVREFATSKDGTKVPVNIIRRKGTKLDGNNPTLLYGYGTVTADQPDAAFPQPERRVWLDGGGVYAIANIRGGGEFGEDWHRRGALTRKQNVFDDFFAAARKHLVEAGYTTPKHLAILGASNGGLLMGERSLKLQHPDEFRASGGAGRHL